MPEQDSSVQLTRVPVDSPGLLARLRDDPAVARTGLAERNAAPEEMISPFAFVWSIRDSNGDAGVVWLDTCTEHYSCMECTLLLHRRGVGIGPTVLAGTVLFAFERLAVETVCFAAKAYNTQVVTMCAKAGLTVRHRSPHPDEFDPCGSSQLVGFRVDRHDVSTNHELCQRLLRRPVVFLHRGGSHHVTVTAEVVSRYPVAGRAGVSGGPTSIRTGDPGT